MSFGPAPELSAASRDGAEGRTLAPFRHALDDPKLTVFVAGNTTDEFDGVASLRRHLAGTAALPERPPAVAVMVPVINADAFTAAMESAENEIGRATSGARLGRHAGGGVAPLVVNRPEVWTLMPGKLHRENRCEFWDRTSGSVCLQWSPPAAAWAAIPWPTRQRHGAARARGRCPRMLAAKSLYDRLHRKPACREPDSAWPRLPGIFGAGLPTSGRERNSMTWPTASCSGVSPKDGNVAEPECATCASQTAKA